MFLTCVCYIVGVPISTQWEVQGYYYPTQIAQFGLSHYSKNLTEPEPRFKVIEDGSTHSSNWSGKVIRKDGVIEYSSQGMFRLDRIYCYKLDVWNL